MRKLHTPALLALLLLLTGTGAPAYEGEGQRAPEAQKTREVKIYLVRVGDNGASGTKIGCEDSLVSVTRTVAETRTPLKVAINELLSAKEEGNYWRGDKLKLKSATISKGTANIRITGTGPYVAGVCDIPRITEQIEWTAKQFPGVRRVRVFVNGVPLARAIR